MLPHLGDFAISKKEPREDNARPQLNELTVTDLRHDYGKYKVVFGGSPFKPLHCLVYSFLA